MYIYTCISHVSSHLYLLDHIYLTGRHHVLLAPRQALKSGVLPDDLKEPGDQRYPARFLEPPNNLKDVLILLLGEHHHKLGEHHHHID